MNINEISNKFVELERLNRDSHRSMCNVRGKYCELLKLKEEIINCNISDLKNDHEIYDYLRFRILEELTLTKIDIREIRGLSNIELLQKLEKLYKNYGGDVGNE